MEFGRHRRVDWVRRDRRDPPSRLVRGGQDPFPPSCRRSEGGGPTRTPDETGPTLVRSVSRDDGRDHRSEVQELKRVVGVLTPGDGQG